MVDRGTLRLVTAVLLACCLFLVSRPAVAQTEGAADLIIVVDTTGSMGEEIDALRVSLNGTVARVSSSLIDLHVVLISSAAVCVPAPLGSGNCASDEKLPTFRHVLQPIGSSDALAKILNTYPLWAGSLRSNARKFFLVVSDDDSAMPAETFNARPACSRADFLGLRLQRGILATQDCNPPLQIPPQPPIISAVGAEYIVLISAVGTGRQPGVIGDLCLGVPAAMIDGVDGLASRVVELVGPTVPPNVLPMANAGSDQTLVGCHGCLIPAVLDGSGSSDPDGTALLYEWTDITSGSSPVGFQRQPVPHDCGLPLGYSHRSAGIVTDSRGGTASDTHVMVDVVDVSTVVGTPGPQGKVGSSGAGGPAGAPGPAGRAGTTGTSRTECSDRHHHCPARGRCIAARLHCPRDHRRRNQEGKRAGRIQ